jgi:hypothetical protein
MMRGNKAMVTRRQLLANHHRQARQIGKVQAAPLFAVGLKYGVRVAHR